MNMIEKLGESMNKCWVQKLR